MQAAISALFDHVYVVSLPRSEDRRAHVRKHFEEVGLTTYTFFDATDRDAPEIGQAYAAGEVMTYPPCFRCGKDSCGRDDCNNVLIAPQVAVCLTYLRLWRAIATDAQRSLVVEDDVLFQPDAKTILASLASSIGAGELVWSADVPRLIRLGWALGADHVVGAPFRLSDELRMSNPCHALTSAYAQALLDRHRRITTTADVFMHQIAPLSGEALTVLPPIASELSWSHGAVSSLIHPKPIRTVFLRKQGDEEAARANEQLVRDHRAHATLERPAPGLD